MKSKRITALILSGVLLCSNCLPALATVNTGFLDRIEEEKAFFQEDAKASPSNANGKENLILPEDHADADQMITDEDEIWLEDDRQATPSDAEEDLENDLSEETKATASNANLRDSHFYCQTMVDDVTITIEAESGILPMGTVAEIEEVEYAGKQPIREVLEASQAYSDQQIRQVSAFDISLWYEGEELIPEKGSVSVTFQSSVIAAEDVFNCEVFHLEEETQQVKLLEAVERQEDSITFETGHFSIYGFLLMAGSREEWDTVKDMELYKTSMDGILGIM